MPVVWLGIDPGLRNVGVAAVGPGGVPLAAWAQSFLGANVSEAIAGQQRWLLQVLQEIHGCAGEDIAGVVVEGQTFHAPGTKAAKRPDDLLPVALSAGGAFGLCVSAGLRCVFAPVSWTGGRPKAVGQAALYHRLKWHFRDLISYCVPHPQGFPAKGWPEPRFTQGGWSHAGDAIRLACWLEEWDRKGMEPPGLRRKMKMQPGPEHPSKRKKRTKT